MEWVRRPLLGPLSFAVDGIVPRDPYKDAPLCLSVSNLFLQNTVLLDFAPIWQATSFELS